MATAVQFKIGNITVNNGESTATISGITNEFFDRGTALFVSGAALPVEATKGSGTSQLALINAWPFASVSNQPFVAFNTIEGLSEAMRLAGVLGEQLAAIVEGTSSFSSELLGETNAAGWRSKLGLDDILLSDAAGFIVENQSPISVLRDCNPTNSRLRYILRRVGVSPNNVNQSIAVDHVNGYLYTQHVSTTAAEIVPPYSEASIINRFVLGGPVSQEAIDSSEPAVLLGHQGLSVEYEEDGNIWLWTSSGRDASNNSGSKAVRFRYKPSADGVIDEIQEYIFYPLDSTIIATTPCVSSDQRFVIVKKQAVVDGVDGYIIRGFDLAVIKRDGPGDYNDRVSFEFFIERLQDSSESNLPLQDMASDGAYLYVYTGNNDPDSEKAMQCFDFRGRLMSQNLDYVVGKEKSLAIASFYEPEGMDIVRTNGGDKLLTCVVAGDAGSRQWFIYESGFNFTEAAGDRELLFRYVAEQDETPDLRIGGGVNPDVIYEPDEFIAFEVRAACKSVEGSGDFFRIRFNNDTASGRHRNRFIFTDDESETTYQFQEATTVPLVNDINVNDDSSEFTVINITINNPVAGNCNLMSQGHSVRRDRRAYTSYAGPDKINRMDFWIGGSSIGSARPWKEGSYIEVYGVRK